MSRLPARVYFGVQLPWSLVPGVSSLAYLPSCHNKKVVQFGHHLKETVLYPVPHRQYVFSIPKILRKFFLYDRKLLGKLSQCASKSLTQFFRLNLGKKTGIPGIVVAIQSFGDYARWHPHLHALVADGLFLESGYFFVMPKVDLRPLREIFRALVLKMLEKEGLIDDTFISMILNWRHTSGFSVHNQVRIKADDDKGIENLSQYIIRRAGFRILRWAQYRVERRHRRMRRDLLQLDDQLGKMLGFSGRLE